MQKGTFNKRTQKYGFKKGVDDMETIREPPKTFEEFMKMSWTEKRRVKEESPDQYWSFIRQIRKLERIVKEN